MKLIKGKAYCFIDNHDDYHFYVFNEGDEIKATFTEFEHDPSDGTDREIGDVEFDAYQISILHCYHLDTTWYAVEIDENDNDWGTGSFDYTEAVAMARRMDAKYIAVIRLGDDPVCERVIDLTEEA